MEMRVFNHEKILQLQDDRFSMKSSNYHSGGSEKHTNKIIQNSTKVVSHDNSKSFQDKHRLSMEFSSRGSIERMIVPHCETEDSILAEVELLEQKLINLRNR